MVIHKSEIKTTFKGLLLAIGSWWIAFPLREKLIEVSPIKNTITLGILLILLVLFWD